MNSILNRDVHHTSVCEQAMHFWREQYSYRDVRSHVSHEERDKDPARHPGLSNEIDRVSGLSRLVKVIVTATERNEEKRSRSFRPEQESVGWMQELADKFSKHGELVVDLPSAKFATSKGCLELSLHSRFAGCELVANFSAASTEGQAEMYETEVFNEKSDILELMEWWVYAI